MSRFPCSDRSGLGRVEGHRGSLRYLVELLRRDERFDWKSGFKTAAFILRHPLVSLQWMRFMQRPDMAALWRRQPRVLDKVLRPYLNALWTSQERACAVMHHYDWMHRTFSAAAVDRMYVSPITLATWMGRDGTEQFSLHLGYNGSYEREGDLTLGLYRKPPDETSPPELLVALTFSVVAIAQRPVLCVGCVQARGDHPMLEQLKRVTKETHGLRPKALLVDVAKFMARRWDVELYGVDPDAHPFTSLRYRLSRRKRAAVNNMHAGYLSLWQDHGGGRVPGGWYALPTEAHARSDSEIPSHKRSMYAKRAELVANIQSQLDVGLRSIERPANR